jgi:glycosyltransferase involved in cell wall biosynthesis
MTRKLKPEKPWHVAHLIGRLGTGGAERQLVNYLLAADRQDFRHTAVCLAKTGERGELVGQVEAAGIPVISLPVRPRFAPCSLRRLINWMRRQNVAVVHTHMHHAALWGRVAGKLAGVPVLVTTEHGKELWKNSLQIAIDRGLSRWTSRHIAVSLDGMQIRRQRERIAADRILLIPNGVPIPADPVNESRRRRVREEFGLPANAPILGTVGRLVEAKGYEHLLAALKILRADHPDLRWLAVGEGDRREALTRLAAELDLSDAVIWAGKRHDIDDLLAAMDLWVMSSIREGLPVALLEAMAAQKPIVATQVGGIPDAARDGREALLVPPSDPKALAGAIAKVLRQPELASELAAAARQRAVAEYGIAGVAKRIEDIYRQELQKAGVGKT